MYNTLAQLFHCSQLFQFLLRLRAVHDKTKKNGNLFLLFKTFQSLIRHQYKVFMILRRLLISIESYLIHETNIDIEPEENENKVYRKPTWTKMAAGPLTPVNFLMKQFEETIFQKKVSTWHTHMSSFQVFLPPMTACFWPKKFLGE